MMDTTAAQEQVHATCVALVGAGTVRGVLLRGPSGAGKSDLALRLVEQGWRLVADDQCVLSRESGQVIARSPKPLAGKIEARGVGIVEVPSLEAAPVALIADLQPVAEIERLPEPARAELLGCELPVIALAALDASAPAKLRLALERESAESVSQAPEPQQSVSAEAAAPPGDRRRLVLVTGLSGAGRSSALNTLEDLGYEAIDNLPLELLDRVLRDGSTRPLALGVDIRTRSFAVAPVVEALERLEADPRLDVVLLFVHCDDEILRRRFTETRRRHPLAQDRPLIDGIVAERRLVTPLRTRADLVIDTSALTPGDFRRILTGHLALETAPSMSVFVMSFSYRFGLPRAADVVFDARFLANPHYDPRLRPLTGRDPEVAAFVRADPDFEPYFERLVAMLTPLLPRYQREGKSYLTIAFGCTGGRHRSVMMAESLAAALESGDWRVSLVHRDLDRPQIRSAPEPDSA